MGQQGGAFRLGILAFLAAIIGCQSNDDLQFVPPPTQHFCETHHCPNLGHIEGRVCSEPEGRWLENIQLSIELDGITVTQHTDENGFFRFSRIPTGSHRINITGHPTLTHFETMVYRGHTARVGPTECAGAFGTLEGRACGPHGRWLTHATISIDMGFQVLETQTNPDGYFTLNEIPAGEHTVNLEQGSFQTSFPIQIDANSITTMPEPVCIPHTTTMAVVTGIYDEVQLVLQNLGYSIREHYTDRAVGNTYDQSPTGTVDLINGSNSTFWVTEFLSDPIWMSEYDIILLNCGLTDSLLRANSEEAEEALQNLRNYVDAGGSIYSSDWASEVIRSAFPNRINFLGDDNEFGHSRIGMEHSHQPAQVLDDDLAASLGQSNLQINLNLPLWSVLEPTEYQPDDLTVLVQGNVFHYDPNDYSVVNPDLEVVHSPLIVHFDFGAGRVLYTSAHTESQTTHDLERVLNYIIFEL